MTTFETLHDRRAHAHPFARTDRSALGVWWWTTDRLLLGSVLALIGLGVLLSFAASPGAAARLHHASAFYFALRQCLFGFAGAAILVAVSVMSPRGVRRLSAVVYVVSILIMLALPLIGHAAKGGDRWIAFAGFSLQPSEFMKPALIVLAGWMFSESQKGQGVPGIFIAFILYAIPAFLLIRQPDFGQTLLITAAFGAAFFVAGVPMLWMAGMGVTAAIGFTVMLLTHGHSVKRLHTFFNADGETGRQVDRAAEAIRHGALFGVGPGEGVFKKGVPEAHTDFIYSVAAEEYGLLFCLALICLFAFAVVRGLYRAMKLDDMFEQVAAAGLFVLVGLQTLINVAVNLNIIPTKGMTLPFISYGGSSMLAMGLTMGMALALTRRRPRSLPTGYTATNPAS
jgi:cell division protein FtsW